MLGFTYKGKHTSEFDARFATKNRPILPEQKYHTDSALNVDGSYDFSRFNTYGETFHEDRIHEVDILIKGKNIVELQRKISRVANWLMGEGELIYDDMKYVVWNAKVISGVDFAPVIYGLEAVLTVKIRVDTWSYSTLDSEELSNLKIGSDIRIGSNMRLGMYRYFNYDLVRGSNALNLVTFSDTLTKPILTFTGSSNSLEIVHDRGTFEYSTRFTNLVIDCDKQRAMINGANDCKNVLGKYPSLSGEYNPVTITVTGNVSMKIIYTPSYIYNSSLEV